jgi:cholesterol transport system auxiliary component
MTKILSLCIALLFTLPGCGALLSKAEPMEVRYFAPSLEPSAGEPASEPALALRLGRIEASDHLRERIAFRISEHEVGYHEGLRWTEQPESYFRRALGRQLFENHRFEHVVAGIAPTLEAELVAFEDLRERNAVRVEARVLVHDGRRVFLERSMRVEESREGDDPAVIAAALSRALQKCVAQITNEVAQALVALPSRSAPAIAPPTSG